MTLATERFHRGEKPWPSGLASQEEISGLMLGNAGIGHIYLRLADPSLPSLLAPVPQRMAAASGCASGLKRDAHVARVSGDGQTLR